MMLKRIFRNEDAETHFLFAHPTEMTCNVVGSIRDSGKWRELTIDNCARVSLRRTSSFAHAKQ